MQAQHSYLLVVAVVLAAVVLLRVVDPPAVQQLRLLAFDSYQRLAPRRPDAGFPVRIVDIDEASLEKVGQWPWPRSELARMTATLAASGARVVAFDLIFSEPDRLAPALIAQRLPAGALPAEVADRLAALPGGDEEFARAVAAVPVVLGFAGQAAPGPALPPARAGFAEIGESPAPHVPAFAGATASLALLQSAARGIGAVNWLPEHDRVVRRIPLLVRVGDRLYPAFALETLRVAEGERSVLVRTAGATGLAEVGVGRHLVPTDGQGQMWLRFGLGDPRRTIPAWRVLAGALERDEVAGRIVLVGASAAGLQDRHSTPLEVSLPGVEVHAQAIEQMLAGRHFRRPDYAAGAELVLLLMLASLVAWLVRRASALRVGAVGLAGVLGVNTLAWLAFSRGGLLLDPVFPTLALAVLYSTATLHHYLRSERDRDRIRAAFARYISPARVEELATNPERLRLGGETRDVTVLFADVRGFTGLAEGLEAEALTRLLNRLFTPLCEVIHEERGTIDKFIGDAVMAFWNAPLDDPVHARHACRAALAMLDALEALNRELAREAGADGRGHKPIRMGIGINSGACCVGNLGSEQRFDYSVLGEPVNVAARLEELTKTYGVPVIIGEATRAALDGEPAFACLELDFAAARGNSRPVRFFALLGDGNLHRSHEFQRLERAHAGMLQAYRERRFDVAAQLLTECRTASAAVGGDVMAHCHGLYAERIARRGVGPETGSEERAVGRAPAGR